MSPQLFNYIDRLIKKHLQQTITAVEKSELEEWMAVNSQNRAQLEKLTNDETLLEELIANDKSGKRIKALVYARLAGDIIAGENKD